MFECIIPLKKKLDYGRGTLHARVCSCNKAFFHTINLEVCTRNEEYEMSNHRTKILILSGDFGDGHKQAAYAIKEVAEQCSPHSEIEIVDFVQLSHPRSHRFLKQIFIKSLHHFPLIYGYLYHKTKHNSQILILKHLRVLGLGKLLNKILQHQPETIICTFPVAAAAVSLLKSSGVIHTPLVTVITDHTDHAYWIHPHTDLYLVSTNSVRHSLMNKTVPPENIQVTGIPVRTAFHSSYRLTEVREKCALSPFLTTILVMGGGYGMISSELLDLLKSSKHATSCQWIIVCGHNETLRQKLTEELSQSPHKITITGYVQNIHEYMAAADLLLTKPGGLSTSEALAIGLPMLLYRPLPGQEQENARYLTEIGAAVWVQQADELANTLCQLLDHPHQLKQMRKNVILARPHQPSYMAWRSIQKLTDLSKENFRNTVTSS